MQPAVLRLSQVAPRVLNFTTKVESLCSFGASNLTGKHACSAEPKTFFKQFTDACCKGFLRGWKSPSFGLHVAEAYLPLSPFIPDRVGPTPGFVTFAAPSPKARFALIWFQLCAVLAGATYSEAPPLVFERSSPAEQVRPCGPFMRREQ